MNFVHSGVFFSSPQSNKVNYFTVGNIVIIQQGRLTGHILDEFLSNEIELLYCIHLKEDINTSNIAEYD